MHRSRIPGDLAERFVSNYCLTFKQKTYPVENEDDVRNTDSLAAAKLNNGNNFLQDLRSVSHNSGFRVLGDIPLRVSL